MFSRWYRVLAKRNTWRYWFGWWQSKQKHRFHETTTTTTTTTTKNLRPRYIVPGIFEDDTSKSELDIYKCYQAHGFRAGKEKFVWLSIQYFIVYFLFTQSSFLHFFRYKDGRYWSKRISSKFSDNKIKVQFIIIHVPFNPSVNKVMKSVLLDIHGK